MNGNKAALVLARIFNAVFFVIFSMLFLEIAFRHYGPETNKNIYWADYKQHLIALFTALVFAAAAFLIYRVFFAGKASGSGRRLRPHASQEKRERSALPVIFICVGIILLLQVLAAYLLWCAPVTDGVRIFKYASDYAVTGNFDLIQRDYNEDYFYMIRYPNNFAALFINAFLYRLGYLLTGRVTRIFVLGLNILSINVAVLFTALLARKTYGEKKSLFVLGLSALFVPFYTYTAYCYTDSLSIPYAVGAILLFLFAVKRKRLVSRLLLFALCGVVCYIGFRLKGSVIVVFVALVVYAFMKLRFKCFMSAALAFVLGFVCIGAVYSAALYGSGIITKEQSYEHEFPVTHWVMMGLHGHGGFYLDDSYFTASIIGKDEKKEANIEVIKERLGEMGADGLLEHLRTKATWTWGDGTYYISHHVEEYLHKHAIHDYVLDDGPHHFRMYAYCFAFQMFLILMMALSALKGMLRPQCDLTLLFRITVFGIFVFLLLWEARSRYLFTFTPFFLLLSADGAEFGLECLRKLKAAFRPLEPETAVSA